MLFQVSVWNAIRAGDGSMFSEVNCGFGHVRVKEGAWPVMRRCLGCVLLRLLSDEVVVFV